MRRLLKADNGMNIFGQGPWIALFTAPSLAGAVVAQFLLPDLVKIPLPAVLLVPPGLLLVAAGAVLWLAAVVQLLGGFRQGRLVTTGAYAVCRNPIYSSFAFFVLPGVALATRTWGYLVVAAVLCRGVQAFIPIEEQELGRLFGYEYGRYTSRVSRLVPFRKPRIGR